MIASYNEWAGRKLRGQPSNGPMGSIHEKYTTFANDKDLYELNDVFKHTFVEIFG